MRGHDAIAQALVDQGVDTVFGVLGDANLFIGDCLMRVHHVNYVAATHEASAVMMAQGWAKATGRLGIATVTHGPGLTNTVTALIDGVRCNTPMLLVSGDTPTDDLHHLQELPQQTLVAATGAGFHSVRSAERIADDVAIAMRRAWAERRPVVLNIPLELEWEEVDYQPVARVDPMPQALDADPDQIDQALGVMATAQRPLILAGRGAVLSGAHDALVDLADALGAPLATSLLGSGYFRSDTGDIGLCGNLSTAAGSEVIAASDCIIAFGASLNRFTTHEDTLIAGKALVQVEIDPTRINSRLPVNAGVVGDAGRVAATMAAMLRAAGHQPSSFRTSEVVAKVASFDKASSFADQSTDSSVDPRTAVLKLDEILPADRTVVVDGGRFMLDALALPVPDPTSIITTHAFGSIGLGTAASIGAATARPDRPTVLLCGDGGFMMGGLQELHTAVHLGCDLIVCMFNDSSYGAEHVQLVNKGMDTSSSMHHWPDFTPVAAALGCESIHVRNLDDFAAAAKLVADRRPGKPVFIEIAVDPEVSSRIAR